MAKNENEILVVEDTAASLKLLSDILSGEGYSVRPASDGELALRSVQAKLPSLVLLDIRMPGIDGYEVCRQLKSDKRTKDIPVIFLSSLSEVVDKIRGFQMGAVDYITKPYNREELLARVHTHIELYRLKNNLEALVRERTVKLMESEKAYKKKADELRIVADYANDWEYWLGVDGRYIYVSPSCERITGYAAEAFYADANLMLRILHPDDRAWYVQHVFETMQCKDCCVSKELRIITKDGQTRYIEHRCNAIIGDDGVWMGQRGSNRDITEHKISEDKIRKSEELFETLFKIVPIPLGLLNKDGEIRYINDTFHQTFGYELQDIPTLEKWAELAYPDPVYRERCFAIWSEATKKAAEQKTYVEPLEYNIYCKNGNTRVVEISGIEINENFIATFFDVTERKEAEVALRRSNESLEQLVKDELEKSREKDYMLIKQSRLAAMGEMINNIAHQWRQPLNALGLMVQDTKMAWKYGEVNESYIDEMVGKSMEQINYMSKTIDDFRSFFKPDKEKAPFGLINVIRRAEHLLSAGLIALGVQMDITINEDTVIVGYENELAQVLLNIIKNAKDAILDNKIQNPKIEISEKHTPQEVIIAVKDNAGGISESVLDRIFEPYFTTKEAGKGTGIGLYMSKIIVEENMGGKLVAYNEGDGAVFEIRLKKS
jgi:PAS domain S-box-containing protein